MKTDALQLENLKYSLFCKRRFLPIFLATSLGAFNDNLLRSGLVVLIAYSSSRGLVLPMNARPEILVTLCSALLIFPMLLFSAIAGPLADKYEKSRLVVLAKIAEIAIMMGACYGFSTQNIGLLMGLLFISGTHTTFYSPIKFSILPDHLSARELLAANGFMAAGSYLSILLGMIAGGLLVVMEQNIIGVTAIGVALLGFFASLFILKSPPSHPEMQLNFNILKSSRDIIAYVIKDRTILLATLALSWFLLVGSVYLAQFANYAQGVVHGDNKVYTLFLTLFSVGVAVGSIITDTLLKGEISARLMPFAALGISIFTYLLVAATPHSNPETLFTFREFISAPKHWPLLGCMLAVSVCGGIYIVPLYALMQSRAAPQYRSRIMAASNLSDSVFMVLAALASALLLAAHMGILDLFLILATLNLGVVWYSRKVIANAGHNA